jgi:hypothetical protein
MRLATVAIVTAATLATTTSFAYATNSVPTVRKTVDAILSRSEAPPPKKWKAVSKKRRSDRSRFEARVEPGTRPAPRPSSRFERLLDERSAEVSERSAGFRSRVGKTKIPAGVSDRSAAFRSRVAKTDVPARRTGARDFSRRVGGGPDESASKAKPGSFRSRVERKHGPRAKQRASSKKSPFQKRVRGRRG